MRNLHFSLLAVAFVLNAGIAHSAHAAGIVCWKDASGKTVGCGDHIPPEYQDNGAEEMNKQGQVVREIQPTTATTTQDKAAADKAATDAQAQQAQKEQQRQDRALLNTFTTVCEIDDKFKRDSQLIQSNTDTLNTNLKNNQTRQTQVRNHIKTAPNDAPAQQELQHLTDEADSINQGIAQKQQQMDDLTKDYQATRSRFLELTNGNTGNSTCAQQ